MRVLLIGVVVLAVAGGLYSFTQPAHGPYYLVMEPYPPEAQVQVSAPCFFTAPGIPPPNKELCRCLLDFLQSHVTLAEYQRAVLRAKSNGQTTDTYSAIGFAECNERVA